MARTMKPASADTVRAWAAEQGWTDQFGRAPKDRGRLNSELVADFDKAHKRNFVHYVPGYKDDSTEQTGGNRNSGSNSRANSAAQVATRPSSSAARSGNAPAKAAKDNTEKATAPAARQERPDPIRVDAQRVQADTGAMVERINIEDAIALLNAAASAQSDGSGPKGMLAYYVMVG